MTSSKEALYYAFVPGYAPGYHYSVMRVTKETDKFVYGSVNELRGGRCSKANIIAKFKTYEQAENTNRRINDIKSKWSCEYQYLNEKMNEFHRQEIKEIDIVLSEYR